ncbi:MAG TPA: peptidase MA family metallohydrolase [Candidatus Marinimicrobia bacterium]|nr:peptidase MA family metallohydrolase [Candidatus Neomarinimicrobiota bacterium]
MSRRIFIGLIMTCQILVAAPQIKIIHPDGYEKLAEFTRTSILNTLPNVPAIWQTTADTIRIQIVARSADFEEVVGSDLPQWVGAVTLFPQDLMVVRSPDISRSTMREYRKTVVHELIHLLQGQFVPSNLTPVWFNEGLALYYAGEFDLRERVVISKALVRDQLIPLAKLERILQFNQPQADLAYAESASIIEFIENVYGDGTAVAILERMRDGENFERAVLKVTNCEYDDLINRWQTYIEKKYNWIFLLDIQNILWLIIPLIAFLAYWSIRRRNKVTLEQWNVEEINESSDEQQI